jgi:hypothetical protein
MTAALAQNAPGLFAMIAVLGAFGAVFRLWLKGLDTLITALSKDVANTRIAHERCEEKYAELEKRFDGLYRDFMTSSHAVAHRLGRPDSPPVLRDLDHGTTRPQREEERQ